MPLSISYDSRRPCQPIVEPGQSREELRQEARELDRLSRFVEWYRCLLLPNGPS